MKWLQRASPADVAKAVPESYQLGDRALYLDAFMKVREAISPDGMIPDEGPKVALHTLEAFDPELASKNIDLSQTYTNEFVKKADAKYK